MRTLAFPTLFSYAVSRHHVVIIGRGHVEWYTSMHRQRGAHSAFTFRIEPEIRKETHDPWRTGGRTRNLHMMNAPFRRRHISSSFSNNEGMMASSHHLAAAATPRHPFCHSPEGKLERLPSPEIPIAIKENCFH